MKFPRSSGILLHPTSLPGAGGIGSFGPDAAAFAQFLGDAGCRIWQMLPLGPTGYGDSPYQCTSAFAGNPLLINLPGMSETASVSSPAAAQPAVKAAPPATAHTAALIEAPSVDHRVDFSPVIAEKRALLARNFERFVPDERYERWVQQQSWLEDFALFTVLKQVHGGNAWTSWTPALASRNPAALAAFARAHQRQLAQTRWEQYVFFRQFAALRSVCAQRGIQLMGDVPIYVAHDSADVWSNPELFQLERDGSLIVQAGVPPDYFSETGQLWGNPIYRWDVMREQKYQWWIERMRAALSMFDIVRLDHFRGFEAYWEVPGNATTAVDGRWMPGPGANLFNALTDALGPLPIVAENLGLITPEVEALREQFSYPGMSVLQFAFASEEDGREFKPHLYTQERVVYTGTHDNDTTLGWWDAEEGTGSTRTAEEIEREHAYARRYLETDGNEMHWTLIRAALASVADTVLVPMQDVLGLGSEARMNLPGREAGNWQFRFVWNQLDRDTVRRLRSLNDLFDRTVLPPEH